MDALTILPFALLLAAVLGLWIHRFAWVAALIAAIAAAYYTGALHGLAALWIAIDAALACVYTWARRRADAGQGRSLQCIAGLGYRWAFLRTRRVEAAIAVHFGLNATHFLLFIYPRIA
jgi:hypothetical protein